MARQQELSDSFLAVNDVSFTVNQGESIGLMGLNGSGKSTLLKMVNGVMRPDRGKVLTRGRIAGLIATGAGFHPQLTGRDNVYLNAAILGHVARPRPAASSTTSWSSPTSVASSTPRWVTTPRACSRGSGSRSRSTWTPTSSWPTRCSPSATGRSSASAWRRCRRSATAAPPCSTSAMPPAACARCVTACWCSRRAGWPSTATSTRASSSCTTTSDDADPELSEDDGRRGDGRRHLTALASCASRIPEKSSAIRRSAACRLEITGL